MSVSAVLLGPSTWELGDRLERMHGDVTVVRRCVDLTELLACSHTGMAHVAIVAEGAEDLTASLLQQLDDNGLRVLVLEGPQAERLAGLGVGSVRAAASGEDLSRRVHEALSTPRHSPGAVRHLPAEHGSRPDAPQGSPSAVVPGGDEQTGQQVVGGGEDCSRREGLEDAAERDGAVEPASSTSAGRGPSLPAGDGSSETQGLFPSGASNVGKRAGDSRGGAAGDGPREPRTSEGAEPEPGELQSCRVVAVWGPAGAPGRTVTALNLAAEAALLGHRVLLVDADTYAASVAASLGMLDEAAGIAQACRLADQGRLDGEGLGRCAATVSVAGAAVDVLTGITHPDRWPELRGSALDMVFEVARERYDLVVADTGFCVEADEEMTTDFLTPRRNASSLSALAAADTVLALAAGDALGVPRLVKALPGAEEAALGADLRVVVTKLRAAAAGRSAEAGVREAWERFSPGHPIHHTLRWDPAACDDALLAGAVLAETAPRSDLRREYAELASTVTTGGEARSAEPSPATGTRLGRRVGAWLRRS